MKPATSTVSTWVGTAANPRCRLKATSPAAPNGTRPSSMRGPDSRSQNIDPRPIPSENTASNRVTTCALPPRSSAT